MMNPSRPLFGLPGLMACLTVAATLVSYVPQAVAQDYPSKPVRLIIPYPPGGGNDTLGRIVAQRLSVALGQQVFVDNKPGAGGNLGTEQAAHAKPDGYTLTLGFVANLAMTPHMGKVNYDPIKDLAPISMVAQGYQILVVHPAFPAKTVPELVALCCRRPKTDPGGQYSIGADRHQHTGFLWPAKALPA